MNSHQGNTSPERGPITAAFFIGIGAVFGSLIGIAVTRSLAPVKDADLDFYLAVRQIIEQEYVRPVDREQLLTAAIVGAVEQLDPYSHFYAGEPLARAEHRTRGTFLGIGAIFARPTEAGRILFPLPGSPAERAGIKVGDEILSFAGTKLSSLGQDEFESRLRGLKSKPLALKVRHLDGLIEQIELTPGEVIDPTVRHMDLLEPGVGYLAITSFSRRTLEEFDRAVSDLQALGARSLVLDLRGNPGGVLRIATAVANRFIDSGALVITETRQGRTEERANPDAAILLGTPLVVLIDSGAASASEVLAGALQDDRRAALVGMATYGKGTIQTLTPLNHPSSMLKITSGFYATPSGRSIDRFYRTDGGSAIRPDIEVPLTNSERNRVHRWLRDYSAPLPLAKAVLEFEQKLGRPPSLRVPRDAQIETALALLSNN